MLLTALFLCALVGLIGPSSVIGGEVVLYSRNTCKSYPTIFAAGTTTGCINANLGALGPQIYGASTSRNIGPSCSFSLYTDKNCKTLAGKLVSSGPSNTCLPITQGLVSYQITCASAVSGTLARPSPESDLTLNSYFQPAVTFRNKPAGNTTFSGYNDFVGAHIKKTPTGNPSSTGMKLASALFSQVASNVNQYTVSASDGGTVYSVTLGADNNNGYTAESVAATMGMAAFGSLMADTVAQLAQNPANYLYYSLSNVDDGDVQMGSVNITYVAPS